MDNQIKLGFISEKYMAEIVAATGSEELMDKGNRPYVGLYDTASEWFVPLRAKVNPNSPEFNHFLTPFKTNNPHFVNPGLDFKKALYVPNESNISEMKNTLPKGQWEYIREHSDEINAAFTNYALKVEAMPENSRERQWSTVPLFPDGIQKIKERQYLLMQMNQSQTKEIDF
ncbi:hypothetical protein [Weissella viridescens]|uniref:hypothetical protein n=1 Tax=Weissella viridescens TaxID=1629 RepID=UPI003AF2BFDB